MVKFRGIEISIISQFDIRKLPEFRFQPGPAATPIADPFVEQPPSPNASAVASCYVPIYAGSQIWFEYAVEGPHPPGAGYFFKLFLDGQLMTSWDCTEKHDYQGKMMYNIVCDKKHEITGKPHMIRQAIAFKGVTDEEAEPDEQSDVAEIRVYRIEHRQRIRELQEGAGRNSVASKSKNNIQLPDGGLLEPSFPHRRYKYQLLDPVDEPYATFRFYYRTLDSLKRHHIIDGPPVDECSSASSPSYHDASSNIDTSSVEQSSEGGNTATPTKSSPLSAGKDLTSPASKASDACLPPSHSEEYISLVTKDSIEDLSSNVPRSPKPIKSPRSPAKSPKTFDEILENSPEHAAPPPPPPSPIKAHLSPRRLLKKDMTVKIDGAEFNVERRKRPLSPFTSAGMLRKLVSSAPPTVTEFGPTVRDEVEKLEERVRRNDSETPPMPTVKRTTRAERGGARLMGFLSQRISKRSTH